MAMTNTMQNDMPESTSAKGGDQPHLWFLENMDRVNRAIQGTSDLDQMMKDVLDTVQSIFDCDRAWLLYACDPEAPSFRVPMEVTKPEYPGAGVLNVDLPMAPDIAQNMRDALLSDAPVTYAAGTNRPINKVTADQFGVQSQMFTAIYPKSGQPWAFGMHQCSFARVWTNAEIELFREIGRRLSDSLSILLTQRDLKKSEHYFRSLFEHMLTGFVRCKMFFDANGDPVDFQYLEVNPMFEKITGLRDVIGKMASEVIPGIRQSDPKLFEIYGRVATTGQAERLEIYVEALQVWYLISVYSVERGFFTVIFENITEQKNKEAQLNKTLNELENIVHALPNIMYVLDTESNLIKWNRRAEAVTGYSADELRRKLSLELIAVHERPSFIEAINDAYDKEYAEVSAHLVCKDGTQLPYRWSAAPMRDAHGNDVGIIGIGWDLTDQIKSEERVQSYQAQLRIILDSIPDTIWMKDARGVYLAANQAFLDRVGKRREDVLGKTDHDVFPKEYADKYRADDEDVAATRTQKRLEETTVDAKGNVIWAETIKTPVYGSDNALIGVAGVARDITEQKETRKALGKQELINQIVSNNLPIGYAVNTISDGKAIFVNKKFEDIYGWPQDILVSVDAFFEHVYPDPDFRTKLRQQVMADIMSGDPVRMVWEKLPIVRQSGEAAYITARNIPLAEYDLMVSTVLDVTHQVKVERALKESHRLQKTILDTIPDMAWVKDTNGVVLLANAAFAAAVQKPIDAIVGKTDYDLWDDRAMADAFRADDTAVMQSGKQLRKQEFMVAPGAGKKVFAETIKMPIYGEDGSLIGTTGIARIIDPPAGQ